MMKAGFMLALCYFVLNIYIQIISFIETWNRKTLWLTIKVIYDWLIWELPKYLINKTQEHSQSLELRIIWLLKLFKEEDMDLWLIYGHLVYVCMNFNVVTFHSVRIKMIHLKFIRWFWQEIINILSIFWQMKIN